MAKSTTPAIAKRAEKLQASPLRKLAATAEKRKKKGVHVYHLNIGQPDVKTHPDFLREVAKYTPDTVAYAPSNGLVPALEAWSDYYKSVRIPFKPKDIVITTGGSEGIIFALEAVADPKDEVIVFEPFYTNYNAFASLTDIKLKPVSLDIKDGFHLPSSKEIEKHITKKTKAILVCNPSNPTGTVFTKEELARVVKIAKKHNLFVLSDEVYREMSYERKHISIMAFPEIRKQAIVLDSASKRFNLCGARIGVVASQNEEVMAAVLKMAMARLSVASIEQMALVPMLKKASKYVNPIVREFEKRRDVVFTELSKIPNLTFSKPEGAFYIIIGLPVKDAEHFAQWMIETFHDNKETVLLAPAAGFYATKGLGKNEVRLAFMLNRKELRRSLQLLRLALEKYPHTIS